MRTVRSRMERFVTSMRWLLFLAAAGAIGSAGIATVTSTPRVGGLPTGSPVLRDTSAEVSTVRSVARDAHAGISAGASAGASVRSSADSSADSSAATPAGPSAETPAPPTKDASAPHAADTGRVGSETCEGCHPDQVQGIKRSVHGRADTSGSCEGCHGPGGAHAESGGDKSLIRTFAQDLPAAQRSAPCLECHGSLTNLLQWSSSDHALAAVACTECHDPHQAKTRYLLRSSTPAFCYGCHGDVKAQFALMQRHPVANDLRKGSLDCVDCHNPHAPTDRRLLGGFKQNPCLKCHTEYRGPWVFEHEAVAVESCTICHVPHGSINRYLLTYQRVGDLCLQCHPGQPYFHVLVDGKGRRTTGFNDCTRCHTEIHGSNNSALFLN